MKIREGYMLREVAGTSVVVPLGAESTFHGMLKLNETGRLIWEKLTTGAERADLVAALLDEYEVTEEEAGRGVDAFLAALDKIEVLEA